MDGTEPAGFSVGATSRKRVLRGGGKPAFVIEEKSDVSSSCDAAVETEYRGAKVVRVDITENDFVTMGTQTDPWVPLMKPFRKPSSEDSAADSLDPSTWWELTSNLGASIRSPIRSRCGTRDYGEMLLNSYRAHDLPGSSLVDSGDLWEHRRSQSQSRKISLGATAASAAFRDSDEADSEEMQRLRQDLSEARSENLALHRRCEQVENMATTLLAALGDSGCETSSLKDKVRAPSDASSCSTVAPCSMTDTSLTTDVNSDVLSVVHRGLRDIQAFLAVPPIEEHPPHQASISSLGCPGRDAAENADGSLCVTALKQLDEKGTSACFDGSSATSFPDVTSVADENTDSIRKGTSSPTAAASSPAKCNIVPDSPNRALCTSMHSVSLASPRTWPLVLPPSPRIHELEGSPARDVTSFSSFSMPASPSQPMVKQYRSKQLLSAPASPQQVICHRHQVHGSSWRSSSLKTPRGSFLLSGDDSARTVKSPTTSTGSHSLLLQQGASLLTSSQGSVQRGRSDTAPCASVNLWLGMVSLEATGSTASGSRPTSCPPSDSYVAAPPRLWSSCPLPSRPTSLNTFHGPVHSIHSTSPCSSRQRSLSSRGRAKSPRLVVRQKLKQHWTVEKEYFLA